MLGVVRGMLEVEVGRRLVAGRVWRGFGEAVARGEGVLHCGGNLGEGREGDGSVALGSGLGFDFGFGGSESESNLEGQLFDLDIEDVSEFDESDIRVDQTLGYKEFK
jgi:hypothetical protein